MRTTFILTMMLAALLLVSCTSYTHVRNGIPDYQSHCGIGGYNCSVEVNDAKYPTAVADIGPMPGGMEKTLAVQRVMVGEQRRNIDVLYGGMMMPYGLGGYGYMSGLRGAGYYNMMPTMQYPPGSFYPATMPTTLPPPYRY